MSPVYENDLLVGMRIYPGTSSNLFAQLGLRSDDLIVAIDGAPIADASTMVTLLEPLTNGAQMNLSVRRGEAIQSVSLDGSVVTRDSDAASVALQQPALPPPG
jgi:type II secretion system protein C